MKDLCTQHKHEQFEEHLDVWKVTEGQGTPCQKFKSTEQVKDSYQKRSYVSRAYHRPILHSAIKCCPIMWKLYKALSWCKTLRKGIE